MKAITSVGEKNRTGADGKPVKGLDHDAPPLRKWTPLGILVLATGALTIIFGPRETSDFWVDGMDIWWKQIKNKFKKVRQLVIYLDNGPNNSGSRTQFLKRMVEFANHTGLQIRLVYYPPYHSKYNPVERCWSALERKWGGSLLNCLKVILQETRRMTWKGQTPVVKRVAGEYQKGVSVSKKEMELYESQIVRKQDLEKYDLTINPIGR